MLKQPYVIFLELKDDDMDKQNQGIIAVNQK
jgi:hypothetical protein